MRTLFVGDIAYIALVCFLRISGKRTLAKQNAFDLVVTVALGSTLSATLLQQSIALFEGALAMAVLIAMQYVVTFISVRSPTFAGIVRSEPSLLIKDGVCCTITMRRERITESEALSAIRSSGGLTVADASMVVLESDGTISVSLKPRSRPK